MAVSSEVQLIGVVLDRLQAAFDRWVDAGHRIIDDKLEDAVRAMLEVTEGESGRLAEAANGVRTLWNKWVGEIQDYVQQNSTAPRDLELPPSEFFSALFQLFRQRLASKLPSNTALEPIVDLRKQGVNSRQICLIYGFTDKQGTPEYDKLIEEEKEPGKHTEDLVTPLARRNAAHISVLEEKIAVWRTYVNSKRPKQVAATESVEELACQGVSLTQIILLHPGVSANEIYERCDKAGIERPPLDYTGAQHSPALHDNEPSVERARILEAQGATPFKGVEVVAKVEPTIGERIQKLANQGLDKAEIAEYFADEGIDVTAQKIAANVREASKEQ